MYRGEDFAQPVEIARRDGEVAVERRRFDVFNRAAGITDRGHPTRDAFHVGKRGVDRPLVIPAEPAKPARR